MAYSIEWFVPGRVIEVTLSEIASDEVILALDNDLTAAMDTALQPVHIIVDPQNMKVYPSAQTAMKLKYYKHPNMGRLIVIGLMANPIIRFLGTLIGRTTGLRMKDCSSREEAHAYLKSIEKI